MISAISAIIHFCRTSSFKNGNTIQLRLRAPGVSNLLTLSATPKWPPHDWFGPNMEHCARRFSNLRHRNYYMFCEYNYCEQVLLLQPTTIFPTSLFLRSSIRDVIHRIAHLDIMSTSASVVSLLKTHFR